MQLTRWTYINRDFEEGSRPSKRQWCDLIESMAVPGKIIGGTPYVDAARFAAGTVFNSANDGDMDTLDLLG